MIVDRSALQSQVFSSGAEAARQSVSPRMDALLTGYDTVKVRDNTRRVCAPKGSRTKTVDASGRDTTYDDCRACIFDMLWLNAPQVSRDLYTREELLTIVGKPYLNGAVRYSWMDPTYYIPSLYDKNKFTGDFQNCWELAARLGYADARPICRMHPHSSHDMTGVLSYYKGEWDSMADFSAWAAAGGPSPLPPGKGGATQIAGLSGLGTLPDPGASRSNSNVGMVITGTSLAIAALIFFGTLAQKGR